MTLCHICHICHMCHIYVYIFYILSAIPCKGSQYVKRRHPLKQQALENVRTVSTTAKGRNYISRHDVGQIMSPKISKQVKKEMGTPHTLRYTRISRSSQHSHATLQIYIIYYNKQNSMSVQNLGLWRYAYGTSF